MKRQGETPEGNLAQPHALDEVEASPFPYLPWLDMAMLTAVGANLEDGLTLSNTPGAVIPGRNTAEIMNWKVSSSAGVRRYNVSLPRSSTRLRHCTVSMVAQQMNCTCPGCQMLKKSGKDKVCKHETAVLAKCLQHHNQVLPARIVRGNSGLRRSVTDYRHYNALTTPLSSGGRAVRLALQDAAPEFRASSRDLGLQGEEPPREVQQGKDSRPREPSPVPAAGAVRPASGGPSTKGVLSPRGEKAIAEFFRGYDPSAEDASCLFLRRYAGVLLAIMSAKQAQKMVVYMAKKASWRVALTGFTYEMLMITEALVECAQRGLEATAFLDMGHALKGSTVWMIDRLSALKKGGVKVYLSHGTNGISGIQHSKTFLADEFLLVGSCNWTNASRQNHEECTLTALNEEGLAAHDKRLKYIQERSRVFDDKMEKEGREHRRARSSSAKVRRERQGKSASSGDQQSVPPADRYRTAKRFSIARARSLQAQSKTAGDTGPAA